MWREILSVRGSTGLEKCSKGKWKTEVKDKNLHLFVGDFYYSFVGLSDYEVSKILDLKSVN